MDYKHHGYQKLTKHLPTRPTFYSVAPFVGNFIFPQGKRLFPLNREFVKVAPANGNTDFSGKGRWCGVNDCQSLKGVLSLLLLLSTNNIVNNIHISSCRILL